MEGIGNPAFNMSSPDLSAYQASEKKVIRHDLLDRTLAAHQQKCRLLASAELRGVTSVLIIFMLCTSVVGDICYAPDLTWASWSQASSIPFRDVCTGFLGGSGCNVARHTENLLCHWCAGRRFT